MRDYGPSRVRYVQGGLRARDWDGKFYNGITGSYQGKFVRPTILS